MPSQRRRTKGVTETGVPQALAQATMARAIELARRGVGRTSPNPPVGAVVLDTDGEVAGEGSHLRAGGPHAEVLALRKAGGRARGGSLFVTLEPCSTTGRTPPCTDAVLASGIAEVFVAIRDPNPRHAGRGLKILSKAGLAIHEGLCSDVATELIRPFAKWVTKGVPFVTLKLGMTLDGRIADVTGASRWITGGASRSQVQALRREADAVLVGTNTVQADNPTLLAPTPRGKPRGRRIVLDARGSLSLQRNIFCDGWAERTIVAVTRACSEEMRLEMEALGATVWVIRASSSGRVCIRSLLKCAAQEGILHILCEGGGELASALVHKDAVDRYVFFVAPAFLGNQGVPAMGGGGWRLGRMPRLQVVEVARIGDDVRIDAVPVARSEG